MRIRISITGTLLALAAFAAAQGASAAVTGFRLPPSPGSAQTGPEAQGPVAEDVPQSRPTPATPPPPAPTPTPTPRATQAPVIVLPPSVLAAPEPAATPTRPAPARTQPATPQSPGAPPPAVTEEETTAQPAIAEPAAPAAPSIAPPPAPAVTPASGGVPGWTFGLAGLLVLLLAGAGLWWRANRPGFRQAAVPVIERPSLPQEPLAAPEPEPSIPPPASAAPGEALRIVLEPHKFGLTLMNATLSYRLEVANQGAQAVRGLAIRADMIAAHASLDREAQLAGPPHELAPLHLIERLEPGETRLIEGEFRLPFPSIVPIRQGSAALLLPLARFRLEADGAAPLTRIFAVGQPGAQPDAALVPFRLDQGPRVYPQLAQRAFA